MSSQKQHLVKFKRCRTRLLDLDIEEVENELIQEDFLSDVDREKLRKGTSQKEKIKIFLDEVLPLKSQENTEVFMKVLRQSASKHIADAIDEYEMNEAKQGVSKGKETTMPFGQQGRTAEEEEEQTRCKLLSETNSEISELTESLNSLPELSSSSGPVNLNINVYPSLLTEEESCFMRCPELLIHATESGEFSLVQRTREMLARILMPIVIIVIVGPYRTGKSYLLNRLAAETGVHDPGFELGETVQSKTKGIWIWTRPHPKKPGHCLALIDTEGLGDACDRVDPNHDKNIFALSMLLGSMLVYNTQGKIDQDAVDKLNLIAHIAERIRVKSKAFTDLSIEQDVEEAGPPESDLAEVEAGVDDPDYEYLFPNFTWVLRDYYLDSVIKGKEVTATEYLNHCLQEKPVPKVGIQNKKKVEKIRSQNKSREFINTVFPEQKRSCFFMVRPVRDDDQLKHMNEVPEDDIEEKFKSQSDDFFTHVLENSPCKQFTINQERIDINGQRFGDMAFSFIQAISNGAAPCIQDAVESMAQIENKKVKENCTDNVYMKNMKKIELPIRESKLIKKHKKYAEAAMKAFEEKKIWDKDQKYTQQFEVELETYLDNFVKKNQAAAKKMCSRVVEECIESYKDAMSKDATLPVPPEQLKKIHEDNEGKAKLQFDEKTTFEENRTLCIEYEKMLQECMEKEYEKIKDRNETVETKTLIECRDKMEASLERYTEEMSTAMPDNLLPLDNTKLSSLHEKCEASTMEHFKNNAPAFHRQTEVSDTLKRKIKNEFKRFEEQNKSARYAKTLEQTAVKLEGTEKDLKLAREETRQTRSMLKENETKLTEATNENKKVKKKLDAQSGRLTETEKKQKETEEKLRQAHDRITKTEADSASYQAELAKISEDLSKEKGRLNEREEELRMVTEVVRKLIQDQGLFRIHSQTHKSFLTADAPPTADSEGRVFWMKGLINDKSQMWKYVNERIKNAYSGQVLEMKLNFSDRKATRVPLCAKQESDSNAQKFELKQDGFVYQIESVEKISGNRWCISAGGIMKEQRKKVGKAISKIKSKVSQSSLPTEDEQKEAYAVKKDWKETIKSDISMAIESVWQQDHIDKNVQSAKADARALQDEGNN